MSNVDAIPLELRERPQWCNWTYATDDKGKETKKPRSPHTGQIADVQEPVNQSDFQTALNNAINHGVGIGFVLTQNDPYVCIDLDSPIGKFGIHPNDIERIHKVGNDIVTDANSYTEWSPSGNGLHVWIRAEVPPNGVRSSLDCIELYSTARFMTVTGKPFGEIKPIEQRDELANVLHTALGRLSKPLSEIVEEVCDKQPSQVIDEIAGWANGQRFLTLMNTPFGVGDDNAIDQGLMNFFVQATKNVEVSRACFALTPRAHRDKWMRNKGGVYDYQDRTIRRAFDALNKLEPVNIDGLIASGKAQLQRDREMKQQAAERRAVVEQVVEQKQHNPLNYTGLIDGPGTYRNPGGLVGELMDYLYRSSYVPIPEVALTGALGLMAGICGRAWNVNDLGLNLYIILLANSGVGKNAAMQAPKFIMERVATRNTDYMQFIGGRPVSAQALAKMFSEKRSFVSFYDEFGEKFAEMNQPERYPVAAQLAGPMMELYTASGRKASMPEILHSKKEDSAKAVKSPAFSMVASSVPQTFYGSLNPKLGDKGLLPRMTIINYVEHQMVMPNHNARDVVLPDWLLDRVTSLCSIAHRTNGTFPHCPVDVQPDQDAAHLWREFEMHCRKTRFAHKEQSHIAALWARTAEKALKLAALIGIGYNPYEPRISLHNMRWAIDFALHETTDIVGKFETGAVGEPDNENERVQSIARYVNKWFAMTEQKVSKLTGPHQQLFAFNVIPRNWLWMQVHKLSPFTTGYKRGMGDASEAFDKALKVMLTNGYLKPVTTLTYGSGERVDTPVYSVGMVDFFKSL